MDRFDLRWPSAEATFFTDGWRCRIVWRQTDGKRTAGGMGGTIENNAQCKQRVAASLDGAPYLISALKARGHDRLAGEIEVLADEQPAEQIAPKKVAHQRPQREARRAGPRRSEPKKVAAATSVDEKKVAPAPSMDEWLAALPGTKASEEVATRRAKQWLEVGEHSDESWSLRAPSPRGKQEWVLKRSWSGTKRKAEYVAAPHLKGILGVMLKAGAGAPLVESLLAACTDVQHEELAAAASSWRTAMGNTH